MKKLLVSFAVALSLVAVIALADSILRPPVVEWAPVTSYSDGRPLEASVVVKYNVYRSVFPETNNWLLVSTTTNSFYSDTNINLAVTYRYRITTELYGLMSEPSPSLTFMTYSPAPVSAAPTVR